MKESLMLEASMTDSFIYGLFNSSGEMQTRIVRALKEGISLDRSYIEEQIIQIQKSRISPLADEVLAAFEEGFIRLIFWNSSQKMTKSIPFVIHKSEKGAVVSIFVSSFGTLNSDGTQLNLPMKNLYVLMESAFIGLNMQVRPLAFKRNMTLMKVCNEVYTEMFMRVLNRDYALSINTSMHDQVSFIISKFFLENVWEVENKDIGRNYAVQTTTEKNLSVLDPINLMYEEKNIHSISDLFDFLKEMCPRMNGLTVRYFVERFINTYGGPSVLSMDYLPYLVFIVCNTMLGGFLVSQGTLSDIVKNAKDVKKFWSELVKII